MPYILRTFIPIEKEELLSASCRYLPRHNKKETGAVSSRLYSPAARKRLGHPHSRCQPTTTTKAVACLFICRTSCGHLFQWEKKELLSASCRYFPRHSKKETGVVLTLILAYGSQAARSPALALPVGLNRAADDVTARTNNDRIEGMSACGFCRSRKRRHSRRRTCGHLFQWEKRTFVRKLSLFSPP